ncbi:dynamin family protein [Desulfospira joergensenii]|uniref:dynamin family protein n=1 Tax=Desulfospira joergensenii TaxID=53329 RepID=UPI0003B50295|nr:dynamin family protein [Desulfospira joergensenii]
MTNKHALTQSLQAAITDLLDVMDMMDNIPGMSDSAFAGFREHCARIPELIESGRVKIAVVGVIKSGKSTFINALIGKELVRRGAGVVTSITTRIRKGKKNRAVITLKSWDEINHILGKTLEMFPLDGSYPDDAGENRDSEPTDPSLSGFDMRRKKDRALLKKVYSRLTRDFPVTGEGIRPETLVLRNAIGGFEFCKDMVRADPKQILFESRSFDNHKDFTADPARAFYVKDVCLEVFGKVIDPHIEIADCQGADSTDPSQLAQIIRYIESANLIVYCISSRTGLRQADIAFLELIKRLGLFENILFLNNCDLTEHEGLDDLKAIESRIQTDLRLFTPDPALYSFSALYDLFAAMEPRLTQKNRIRLDSWRTDKAMTAYCNENSRSFHGDLSHSLARHHFDLLISNHVERLRIIASAMDKKAAVSMEVLGSEEDDQARARARTIRENGLRLRSIVDNSVEGAVSGLKGEIEDHLKSVFSRDSIHIRKKVRDFIKQTPIDPGPYRHMLRESGFKQILYLMFQDFKRKLDLFAVEHIIPDLKTMVREQEDRIETYFQSLLDSYRIDFLKPDPRNSLLNSESGREVQDLTREILEQNPFPAASIDIPAVKKILGLELPQTLFSPRYTKRIRTSILTGLSLHSLVLLITSCINKNIRFSFTPGFKKAGAGIKKKCLESFRQQIDQYHEILLDQYFIPLIRAATRDFKDKIHDRFSMYATLDQDMEHLLSLRKEEKKDQEKKISIIRERVDQITRNLESIGSN